MTIRRAAIAAIAATLALGACARENADERFVRVVKQLRPSVVLLTMKIPPENKKDQYDDGYASGFVVASGDWGSDILSVEHAIEGAWDLSVTVGNRDRVPVNVVARDATLDLAVLRTPRRNLPVLALGSSSNLEDQLGRQVALLGYPIPDEFDDEGLGLKTSVTTGILSSVRHQALEVTLAVIPGDSGAPVFIADTGEVIGIAESRFDDERSIGFALPIDDAKTWLHKVDQTHGF